MTYTLMSGWTGPQLSKNQTFSCKQASHSCFIRSSRLELVDLVPIYTLIMLPDVALSYKLISLLQVRKKSLMEQVTTVPPLTHVQYFFTETLWYFW